MSALESVLLTLLIVMGVVVLICVRFAVHFYRKSQIRQTKAYELGGAQVKGDMYQLLGTFAALDDYEQVIMLSTTSKQCSLDLIGINTETIDFIEFKKKGATLRPPERKIKNLVEGGKIRYIIKDVDLPEHCHINDRPARKKPDN